MPTPAIVGSIVTELISSTPLVNIPVTIPAGAAGMLVFWGFDGGNGNTVTSLSCTGTGVFSFEQNVPTVSGSFERCAGVACADVTATGPQTWSAAHNSGIGQGAIYLIVFIDQAPVAGSLVRGSGGDNTAAAAALSVSSASGANDLVFGLEVKYNAVPAAPTGWTSAASAGVYNGEGARLSTADSPGASTTTYTAPAPDYSAAVIIALIGSGGGDTTPPVITGPGGATGATSAKSIPENTTAVHTFTANEAVTWDLNGGADVALFSINSSTGSLSFLAAPDFESPADSDTNNTYVVGVRATDGASNATTQALTVTVTDVDETSPNLSAQTASSAAPLTCQGSVTTNEGNGTLYVVFTASATAPSAAQVKLGQDHTGAAALRAVSQAVSGTGAQNIASGAITAGTRYMHAMHEDAAANQSAVVSTSSFTVAAAYTITTDPLEDEANVVQAGVTIDKVYAVRISDNVLVKTWTAQVTNGSGQLVLSDAALTAVPHAITTISNSNADAGAKVYTPTV